MFARWLDNLTTIENSAVPKRNRTSGARPRKFGCGFDALEARTLFAGDLKGALTHEMLVPATPDTAIAHFQAFPPGSKVRARNAVALSRPLLNKSAPSVNDNVAPHPVETTLTNHTGPYGAEVWKQRWYMDGDRLAYELQIFLGNTSGTRMVFGQEQKGGSEYVVEMWNWQGQRLSTSVFKSPVYDTRGNGLNLITQTTFLGNGQGQVEGKWSQDHKTWVETTNGSPSVKEQTSIFDKPDGALLSRTTIDRNNVKIAGKSTPNGQWSETTTGSKAFREQTSLYTKPGGTLLSQTTIADGGIKTVGASTQAGQWSVTTTGSPAFKEQTEVFDKPGDTLLSSTTVSNDGSRIVGSLNGDGVWSETSEGPSVTNATAQFSQSGNITLASANGGTNIYQKVAGGWRSIAANHNGLQPGIQDHFKLLALNLKGYQPSQIWAEDTWAPNGEFIETLWKSAQHGAAGSADELGQLVIQKDSMTLTQFHATGYKIYHGLLQAYSQDATVTRVYSRKASGGIGTLLEYHVAEANSSWAADWKKPNSGRDLSGYYPSGWLEYLPNSYSVAPDINDAWRRYAGLTGVEISQKGYAPVRVPPGVTATASEKNGTRTETYWDQAHAQSLTFVYANKDQKDLIEQTYGRTENGKWVTTTDHSKAFVLQTLTYNKPGGNLLSSVTTRKAPDDRDVTFTGTWTSGTAMNNVTGSETATNYLNFSSVTVNYQNGKAIIRSGPLQSGGYAVDTFDSKGTAIVNRKISNPMGGPVVQTWTGSDNELTVTRDNPIAGITSDKSKYVWKTKAEKGYFRGYNLVNFDATYTQPTKLFFTPKREGGKDEGMFSSYDWRGFTSYSKADEYWDWHYRELGSYNAPSSPNPQVPGWSQPSVNDLSHYWTYI